MTERVKSLGMDGSTFQVILNTAVRDCADASAYADGSILGVDAIDFLLLHRQIEQKDESAIMVTIYQYRNLHSFQKGEERMMIVEVISKLLGVRERRQEFSWPSKLNCQDQLHLVVKCHPWRLWL